MVVVWGVVDEVTAVVVWGVVDEVSAVVVVDVGREGDTVVGVDWFCPSLCTAASCGTSTFAESGLLQPQTSERRINTRDERRTAP